MADQHIYGLRDLLVEHEGYSDQVYPDDRGNPTTGVGANMKIPLDPAEQVYFQEKYGDPNYPKRPDVKLTVNDVEFLFQHRQSIAEAAARRYMGDEWGKLSPARQAALADVAYNQGAGGLFKFRNLRTAISKGIKTGDWEEAAYHINDPSVPLNRRPNVTNLMLTGMYPKEAQQPSIEEAMKARNIPVPQVDPSAIPLNRSDYEALGRAAVVLRNKENRTPEDDDKLLKMAWTLSALDKKFKLESASGLLDPANDELLLQAPTLRTKGKAAAARLMANPMPETRFLFEVLGTAAYQRLQDFGDFMARPFLTQQGAEVVDPLTGQRTPGPAGQQEALQFQKDRSRAELAMVQDATARELGIPTSELRGIRGAGKYAPDVVAGVGTGLLGTATRRAVMGGLEAAGGVGADVPLTEDPTLLSVGTGVLGAGLGGLFELPSAGSRFLLRRAIRAEKTGVTADSQRLARAAEVDLSLGEASGDQLLREMESNVPIRPETPRYEFMQRRRKQVMNLFFNFERKLNPADLSTESVIDQTETIYRSTLKKMQKDAGERFRAELLPAIRELGGTIDDSGRILGGRGIVEPRFLRADLEAQLREAVESGAPKGLITRLENELANLNAAAADGGLKLGAVQRRLADLGADANPSGRISTDLSSAAERVDSVSMLRALEKDLETTANELPDGALAASLRTARRVYEEDKELIGSFKNTAIDKLLGKAVTTSAEDFVGAFTRMPETQFRKLMRIIDTDRPELGQALRGRWFAETVERSKKISAMGDDTGAITWDLDYDALIKRVEALGPSKLGVLLDVMPSEASRMTAGLQVLKRITSSGMEKRGAVPGQTTEWMDMFRNIVSQDPTFGAGLLARLSSPALIEKALFTDAGQTMLKEIGARNFKAASARTAAMTLMQMLYSTVDQESQDAARQAILKEEAAAAARAIIRRQQEQTAGRPGRMQ